MVYVVTEGRIIVFPNATGAKPSGVGGVVVHIIGEDNSVIGNFPMRTVKYYGTELPPTYQQDYENQLAWAALTPEERTEAKAKAKKVREGGSA
jgi:hypothetical protein